MDVTLQPLEETELESFVSHLVRQVAQSELKGSPTMPLLADELPTAVQRADRLREGWSRALNEPGWIRTWAFRDNAQIVGHVQVHGGKFQSELHRASIGMEVEASYRGRGHGRHLLETLLRWTQETTLEWIDLGVFANNTPAVHLYERIGFNRTGIVPDKFRIGSQKVDVLYMALKLRP